MVPGTHTVSPINILRKLESLQWQTDSNFCPFIYLFISFFSVKVNAKKQGIQDSIANGSTKTQTVTDIQSSNFIYTLHRFFMNTEHVSTKTQTDMVRYTQHYSTFDSRNHRSEDFICTLFCLGAW